jgi:acyl-CoA synthetase (AMP-forming)/AMP-acid ligase II
MRMLGYWRDEAATKDKFRGKWLRTGDVGSVDEDGFLNVAGRAADVINRGGEKIHATQVEAALSEMPEIAAAAVVGTPHPVLGERVVAAIVLRAGGELDPQAVRSHLLARVADYAVPDQLFACDDLPRNAAGKLDRRRIRQEVLGMFDCEAR